MESSTEADRLLDAAEQLFYERGYQAVGMDALREASGVPLKRIYALFGGKEAVIITMLDRRDERWHELLAQRVAQESQDQTRALAVFDFLAEWLAGEGHRGCAWINAFGELGGVSPDVTSAVRRHKERFRDYVHDLVAAAGAPHGAAEGVYLLAEGAMVTAGIAGDPSAASQAKASAAKLLTA